MLKKITDRMTSGDRSDVLLARLIDDMFYWNIQELSMFGPTRVLDSLEKSCAHWLTSLVIMARGSSLNVSALLVIPTEKSNNLVTSGIYVILTEIDSTLLPIVLYCII